MRPTSASKVPLNPFVIVDQVSWKIAGWRFTSMSCWHLLDASPVTENDGTTTLSGVKSTLAPVKTVLAPFSRHVASQMPDPSFLTSQSPPSAPVPLFIAFSTSSTACADAVAEISALVPLESVTVKLPLVAVCPRWPIATLTETTPDPLRLS